MIGRLRGELASKQAPYLLLDVNGVGYELEAPLSTIFALPDVGEKVTLLTHLIVREDAHILYAFSHETERTLFRNLLKVNGVGAKMALTILSGMNAEEFSRCVELEDVAALVRLPGIGKKTAERLIIEMRDRLAKLPGTTVSGLSSASSSVSQTATAGADAVSALIALGYKPQDASRMVKGVEQDGMDSEALIRAALQGAAKK
jgi:Holliday junction DNA helicase RuvA